MYPMLMAGVSCTQSSRFFRRRVGVPFAASYSYSSLSSFSAKSIFRNPPCCVCNSLSSFLNVNRLPSLSQSSPYGLAMHRSLSTPCRNWLPASARPLFAPFASTRLQGPPFSRPSRCQSPTVLSSVLSVLSRLASSLSRLRLRRYSIPRYPRSPDSTRFSIFVSGPIIIHCIHILYPVSAFAAQPAPSSLHSCILCPYPPSSPRSCRLDLLLYRPRQGLLVDPRLFILRWPSQGCDHVSDAHGGCIVYPMFTILSSFEGFLAASPVPFAAS